MIVQTHLLFRQDVNIAVYQFLKGLRLVLIDKRPLASIET